MNRKIGYSLFLLVMFAAPLEAQWEPNDDTFDPSIHSVVIDQTSWLGDPSPFVHLQTPRTGYTHVNVTRWDGFDPSVQLSLMVPLRGAEKTPPGGGMLMLNTEQTAEFIKAVEAGLKVTPKDKRLRLTTGMKDADWSVYFATEKDQKFIQLEHKSKDKVDTYRFTVNASKKLLGAIRHSLEKLESP